MDLQEKLGVLTAAARYDASCASSGSQRSGPGVGNTSVSGICHSWSEDGRCISLLKILMTNHCIFDCAYCANRRSNDLPRAGFTPEEVVKLTVEFYKRNYIEGLFLSSGIWPSPQETMERMLAIVRKLRREEKFHGYIHLKAIPGAPPDLLHQAGELVDRLSVNIELPSEASLKTLAPQKHKASILAPMGQIAQEIVTHKEERRVLRTAPRFAPAGQSTQLIIGASPESDRQILQLSKGLYDKFDLKRVYYSAYIPVNQDTRLQTADKPDLLREHRMYQADWLVRLYGFEVEQLVDEASPQLDRELDPKAMWALRHPHYFPLDVQHASYEQLIRVPGLGLRSARRLVSARRFGHLRWEDLPRLGVVMKRARFFLSCTGRTPDRIPAGTELRQHLAKAEKQALTQLEFTW